MTRFLFAAIAVASMLLPINVTAQDKKARDPILAAMMKTKLKSAHLVLEGVALADFNRITGGGQELIRLAKSETWQLIHSPQYEKYNADFVRATEQLVKKSQEKNIDGAALAYLEMTKSCVQCHAYVREHRRDVRIEADPMQIRCCSIAGLPGHPGAAP
jgi:cytochrome c556